jgi:hypothetical protein
VNGMDVRWRMILGADEYLDRVNPEERSGHLSQYNLSDRLLQHAMHPRIPEQTAGRVGGRAHFRVPGRFQLSVG